MSIASVIWRAASAATISSTTENAPAASTARASASRRSASAGAAPFHLVAALLAHALRQHPDVRHQRNSCPHDRLDLRDVTGAAFQFHRLRAGLDQAPRVRDRLLRRVVGADGKIGHEQRPLHPARRGPGVMQHFLERHLRRVGITEHDHA